MTLRRLLAVLLLILTAACGGGREATRGVVVEVEGGIADVTGFLLLLPDGSRLRLQPAEGVLFHEDASLGHLRDHLRSGEPVEVEFERLPDGTAIAYSVSD